MPAASTRKQAKQLGDKHYFTGVPCTHGHLDVRYTATGRCAECARVSAKETYRAGYRAPKSKESKARAYRKWRENNPKHYWASATVCRLRTRAKSIGVPFDLTTEWLQDNTPEVCPVFGTPFVFLGNGVVTDTSASLDRLVPSKGYTKDNVVVVSMKANTIKSAYSSKEIRTVADWLAAKGY